MLPDRLGPLTYLLGFVGQPGDIKDPEICHRVIEVVLLLAMQLPKRGSAAYCVGSWGENPGP